MSLNFSEKIEQRMLKYVNSKTATLDIDIKIHLDLVSCKLDCVI